MPLGGRRPWTRSVHRPDRSATGRNGRHALVGLLRQSVFGRLAGYEDVNDALRLRHDPAMRWIVGGKAAGRGRSPAMGRFETRWLTAEKTALEARAMRAGGAGLHTG